MNGLTTYTTQNFMNMKTVIPGSTLFILMLVQNPGSCQESKKAVPKDSSYVKIELKDATIEQKEKYAVWRSDYYICTGIAYAKSIGQTVEDFATFVASKHYLGSREKGLTPVVKLLHFVFESYPDGHLDIIEESDSAVTMSCNRPYSTYFSEGPVLEVTLEEFERFLYQHIKMMAKNIGIDFTYFREGDSMVFTLAK
jgi:hypothetical protein